MKSVAVFCGSNSGSQEIFLEQATRLGVELANRKITLVYGGAKVGLMGAVADGAIARGGRVIGVLPHFLKLKEFAHNGLDELIMVDSMHQRKLKMSELSDGFIAMPGGYGTLEEFFETLTWAQLGLHKKPMGILNVDGYYDSLITLIKDMADRGFLNKANKDMMLVSDNIDNLLMSMDRYQAPLFGKWVSGIDDV